MRSEPPLPSDDLETVIAATGALWPQLKNARILITGGTGFFGRWILESLIAANDRSGAGIQATVLSRDPEGFLRCVPHLSSRRELRWVRGSVATVTTTLFSGERFDFVFHLATEADSAATLRDPIAAIDVIADGTRRMLEVARETGARRVLFASSGSVYGSQPATLPMIPETFDGAPDPTNMDAAYAISGEAKRQAELWCCAYARQHKLTVVIARGFTFAGPAMPLHGKFAFGNFLRDALEGKEIVITGDGTPVRSYLYASDLVVWLWTLLLQGKSGRAYNVGSENAVDLRALAELVAHQVGAPKVTVRETPKPGSAPHRYVPGTRRAREELGLRETVGSAEAIRRTAAWERSMVKH